MNWLVYLLVGKVMIYLWQQFPLPTSLEKYKTIEKLHHCDLCAGVWIYAILSYVFHAGMLQILGLTYIPLISEILTGGVVSFVVHIFSIGWQDKFAPDIVI